MRGKMSYIFLEYFEIDFYSAQHEIRLIFFHRFLCINILAQIYEQGSSSFFVIFYFFLSSVNIISCTYPTLSSKNIKTDDKRKLRILTNYLN